MGMGGICRTENKPRILYEPQKILKLQPQAINKNQSKIINEQMDKSVCKIKCHDGTHGTGFFCNISEENNIKALISNNHILRESDIKEGKTIEFYKSDEQITKKIKIDNDRKTYTNEKYDISIIEIKSNDDLGNILFLEIEDNEINEIHNKDNKLGIYIIHYPLGLNVSFSLGKILYILEDGYTIHHLCETQEGSSGGPLINVSSHKVIGVHKGVQDKKEYNLGSIIKIPIKEFLGSIKYSFPEKNEFQNFIPSSMNKSQKFIPSPVAQDQLEMIIMQMKNCVVKIYKKNGCRATGFFANIPVNDKKKIPVLITCNHFMYENDISLGKEINFSKDDDKINYKIKIDKNRKTYTSKVYDLTFIEIKESDKISSVSFLEIDENLEHIEYSENILKNQQIYLLHYIDNYPISYSIAELGNKENNYRLYYKCSTGRGSCGCPIILLSNKKVIGVHNSCMHKLDTGIGTYIKYPIKDFISTFV